MWKVCTARPLLPGNSGVCYRSTPVVHLENVGYPRRFLPQGRTSFHGRFHVQSVGADLRAVSDCLSECIDKAVAHIEAKQLDPNFFLNMRLFPDMYPYARQVQQASTHAARCCSALAGTDMPNMPNTETSFAELKARLAKTIDYCKTFKPAQIDGTEDKDITIKLGANERKFTGQGLLQNFILPNFYFHCTTAYDILRHCGVELSKRDFMSTPVNL